MEREDGRGRERGEKEREGERREREREKKGGKRMEREDGTDVHVNVNLINFFSLTLWAANTILGVCSLDCVILTTGAIPS